MEFEWSSAKNERNIAKHGIGFAQAARIFESDVLTFTDDRRDYGEERKISIGKIDGLIVIVVVHTDRNRKTRLISARPAKKKERMRYEEEIRKRT